MSFFGNVDFQKLTYTERTCYSYLRDNVDKIPYMRVRDIALEAHVVTSSVMRLIHKMGYDSYTDFKEYIIDKKELEKGSSNTAIPFSLDIFSNDIEQRLDNLAHRVIESDNIIFTGVGSSGLICDYAARRLAGVGINTFSFSDVTYPIASKLQNTTNTLVIALSDISTVSTFFFKGKSYTDDRSGNVWVSIKEFQVTFQSFFSFFARRVEFFQCWNERVSPTTILHTFVVPRTLEEH